MLSCVAAKSIAYKAFNRILIMAGFHATLQGSEQDADLLHSFLFSMDRYVMACSQAKLNVIVIYRLLLKEGRSPLVPKGHV